MENWIQLTFPIDQTKDETLLPRDAREHVVEAMASLLLQVHGVEERKEAEDDLRQ